MSGVYEGATSPARAAVDVIWYHGPIGMKTMAERLQPLLGDITQIAQWHIGAAFVGEAGVLVADYSKIVRHPNPRFKAPWRQPREIPPSPGHYMEWLKACRGEGKSLCNFDYSGKLIEHNLLGNVAHRAGLGQTLNWDAAALKFTGHDAANALLGKTYQPGWSPV
jgi:hypothetical protein